MLLHEGKLARFRESSNTFVKRKLRYDKSETSQCFLGSISLPAWGRRTLNSGPRRTPPWERSSFHLCDAAAAAATFREGGGGGGTYPRGGGGGGGT